MRIPADKNAKMVTVFNSLPPGTNQMASSWLVTIRAEARLAAASYSGVNDWE
jgi:hypothetical protein